MVKENWSIIASKMRTHKKNLHPSTKKKTDELYSIKLKKSQTWRNWFDLNFSIFIYSCCEQKKYQRQA